MTMTTEKTMPTFNIKVLHNQNDVNGINQKVEQIIHISDIHIRQGDIERSRYNEYKFVFNKFIKELESISKIKNTIVVITGDVFHNKGRMDTPAIKLFFRWMTKMLNLAPVFIICGNHDFRQEDPDYPDMIEVMTFPYLNDNDNKHKTEYPLFYLKETGQYVWHNIGFGLVSVKDTLRVLNTSGIIQKLPDFPSVDNFETLDNIHIDYKLALFHGTLLPFNSTELKNIHGYRLEWFEGYDAVLLGDNHLQQLHTNKMNDQDIIWGYPGSLIQQNFGEYPIGHGYIIWNLNSDNTITAECKHIANQYGMITVKKSNETHATECDYNVILNKKEILKIEDAIKHDMFPKYPRIRVIGKTGEDEVVNHIFKDNNIEPESIIVTIPIDDNELNNNEHDMNLDENERQNVNVKINQMTDINHTDKWIQFLEKTFTEDENESDNINEIYSFITHPETMKIQFDDTNELSKEIIQKIKTRNTKIDKALTVYNDIRMQHHGNNCKIILKHMSWDYVMCYGANNYFDFKTLQGKICLLNGRNAIGKSAFIDVLCIGLYGEVSKQRHLVSGKKMTAKMIHDHRPANVSMSVAIMFYVNNDLYEIYRSFSHQSKEENLIRAMNATVCKCNIDDKNGTKTIICEGTTMVNEWIEKRFGTIDDILMSTFVSQIETNNFFHLKQDEQKAILDKALHLESIAAYGLLLKETILAHNDITSTIHTSKITLQDLCDKRKSNVKDISSLKDKISKYSTKLTELDTEYKKLSILIGNNDYTELDKELSSTDISSIKKQVEKKSKKLLEYGNITDEDKKMALMIQGEQKAIYDALLKEKESIGEGSPDLCDISTQEIKETLSSITEHIEKHMQDKPKLNISPDTLKKELNELEQWKKEQNEEWLENPDDLEMYINEQTEVKNKYQKKYDECIQNPVQKPNDNSIAKYKEICADGNSKLMSELNSMLNSKKKWTMAHLQEYIIDRDSIKKKWNHLMKTKIVPSRNKEGYEKWQARYSHWHERVKDVMDDTIENYEKRYDEYNKYISTIEDKISKHLLYEDELIDIESELDLLSIDKIPYNPECFACKQQPMRTRYNQLCEKLDSVKKNYQKVNKYLQKVPHFNLNQEKEKIKEMAKSLKTKQYYEETCEEMETENDAWEKACKEWGFIEKQNIELEKYEKEIAEYDIKIIAIENHLWMNWQSRQKSLKETCNKISNDIEKAAIFIKEYEDYTKRSRYYNDEQELHNTFNIWTTQYDDLINKQNIYEQEYKCRLLDDKFTAWQKQNNTRIDLVEKIRTYETLQNSIMKDKLLMNYNDLKKVINDKTTNQNEITKLSSEIACHEKDIDDVKQIEKQITMYDTYYKILIKRKEALSSLETKFIGDKNNDEGYKEWVYKNHVIPLIEKEINRFLSLIDTIRLKINYADKSFQYMVIDRGNMPTLAMCSGYQRFIVGIALRLAFACIGATGQNIRHFFIDEGFVACDAFNLEKVQSMLRKILEYGGYENIILMSHLEAIRDAADLNINIERDGMFSQIQWGTSYPRLTKITENIEQVKTRGRPKKS